MKSLPRFVVAALLLLAASAAGRAQSIAELPDDKFKLIVDKTTIYDKVLAAARIIEKSYDRYATWVDVKTGPTAKEKTVDGFLFRGRAGLYVHPGRVAIVRFFDDARGGEDLVVDRGLVDDQFEFVVR